MGRQWLSGVVLMVAVGSSVATSAPRYAWNVVEHEKIREVLDRDTSLVSFFVELEANEIAMSMPGPVYDVEPTEPDEPAEIAETIDAFQATLEVHVEARTTGTFGIGAEDTDVTVRLLSLEDELLAEGTVFAAMQEPGAMVVSFDGLFLGCPLDRSCLDAYRIEVESSQRSRVVVELDVWARLNGPQGENAPKDAAIAIELVRE